MPTELCELAVKYGVDKCTGHSYTPQYHILLNNLRGNELNMLEIGIGNMELMRPLVGDSYQPGASLRMWRDYFPKSHIFGCDIVPEVIFSETRIKTYLADQSNKISLLQLMQSIKTQTNSETLDIILDDGLHSFNSNVCFFENSIHKLNKNGYYIIEDVTNHEMHLFENKIKEWEIKYPFLIFNIIRIPSTTNSYDNNLICVYKK